GLCHGSHFSGYVGYLEMTERTYCCVPYCRHTSRKFTSEWICGEHWRGVPKASRRRLSMVRRRYRRRFGDNGFWEYPAGSPDRLPAVRLDRLWRWCWERCKRIAIERGVGL